MSKFLNLGASILALSLSASASFAATLNVVGGELIGASDVNVTGTLYDVSFVDGTCAALFDGCDDASDFAFDTAAAASAASTALLTQVLLDGPLGNFDTMPTLTRGVGPATFSLITTPFAVNADDTVETYLARNWPTAPESPFGDRVDLDPVPRDPNQDFGIEPIRTWALWSAVSIVDPDPDPMSAVPLPAGGMLLLSGLGGFVALKRRKKRAA